METVRVLIVDDQEPFRQAAQQVVEATDGFMVAGSAASGEESLEAAARLRPDLVLMDVHLPGIDGLESSRRLQLLDRPPVVILVSTYDRSEYGEDADEGGAKGYLSKSDLGPRSLTAAWLAASS